MKKKIVMSAIALTALATATTADAQDFGLRAKTAKALVQRIIKHESSTIGSTPTDGMDLRTTKANQTTSYTYDNGAWEQELVTKTEYNKQGYVTATETESKNGKKRTENTYDSKLEGLVTKTTEYTWDSATSTWTDPTVTTQVELTRDDKDRVTKETVYTLNEDDNTLEKMSEVEYGYSILTGKLNTISTTVSLADEGMDFSLPLKVTILKWKNYNENKLFNFALDDMGFNMLADTDNLIENATLTMTLQGFPLTGSIKGTYTDTSAEIKVDLMSMMSVQLTNNITDENGSYVMSMTMSAAESSDMTETVKVTNNEYGDCVRIETEGNTEDYAENASTRDLSDINIDDLDINQTLTIDYEYLTTSDNGVLKKTMTVNSLDKETEEAKPMEKTVFDSYIDYVSGATGISSAKSSPKTQNKAVYDINGSRMRNISSVAEKSVYIVKDGDKTYKIAK